MTSAGDNRCPVCRAALWAPDSEAVGQKSCPRCGAALWVLVGSDGPMFFLQRPGESKYSFLAALAAPFFGLPAHELEAGLKSADNLDMVEVIMEIEEAVRSGRCLAGPPNHDDTSDPAGRRPWGPITPCCPPPGDMHMALLYKVDSRRRTFAEHWRLQWPNVDRFLVAAFCKLLGIPQRSTFGIRRPEELYLHELSEVPGAVRERLADTVEACADVGLAFQFYASIDATVGTRVKAYLAAMLHVEGLIWASAIVALVRSGYIERVHPAKLTCFSRLPDGRYVVTSDHRWKLTPHPGDLVEYLDGSPPDVVVARHYERIDEPALRPVGVREDELAGVILQREQRHVDYQVERGVYVPMTEEEIDRIAGRW